MIDFVLLADFQIQDIPFEAGRKKKSFIKNNILQLLIFFFLLKLLPGHQTNTAAPLMTRKFVYQRVLYYEFDTQL